MARGSALMHTQDTTSLMSAVRGGGEGTSWPSSDASGGGSSALNLTAFWRA